VLADGDITRELLTVCGVPLELLPQRCEGERLQQVRTRAGQAWANTCTVGNVIAGAP